MIEIHHGLNEQSNDTFLTFGIVCFKIFCLSICTTILQNSLKNDQGFTWTKKWGNSDVGDLKLVTICGFWWHLFSAGARRKSKKKVGNWRPKWPKSSPTSYTCHQHISSLISVTNINVTENDQITLSISADILWNLQILRNLLTIPSKRFSIEWTCYIRNHKPGFAGQRCDWLSLW